MQTRIAESYQLSIAEGLVVQCQNGYMPKTKTTFWDRVVEAMRDSGYTSGFQAHAARLIGIKQPSVNKWTKGKYPSMDNATDLARKLNVSVDWLLTGKGQKKINSFDADQNFLGNTSPLSSKVQNVPLISWVQAGAWNEAVDMHEPGYAEDWEPVVGRVGENTFALRVEGDSMEPEFPEGAIIIVDPSVDAQNGHYVIAKVKGAATFKRLVYETGRAYLKPLNNDYKTMEMPEDGQIVGVVVAQGKRYV